MLCWTLPSPLQLEEKNCNGLRSSFQALSLLLLSSLAVHTARCCQHLLLQLSSTFISTTCSNLCQCISLTQIWNKSITYTCSPCQLRLFVVPGLRQGNGLPTEHTVTIGTSTASPELCYRDDTWWKVEQAGFTASSFRDVGPWWCSSCLLQES